MLATPSGFTPSPPDPRDLIYRGWTWGDARLAAPMPFAPRDQGEVPCCVSMAIVGAVESLQVRDGLEPVPLSAMYHYWHARPSILPTDVAPRRGLKTLRANSLCAWGSHPLGDTPFDRRSLDMATTMPGAEAAMDAQLRRPWVRTLTFETVPMGQRARRWKAALGKGTPVLIGLKLTPAYYALEHEGDAILSSNGGVALEGHMALVVGHGDRHFAIRDSRGTHFGDQGHWLLPEAWARSSFIIESWVLS